MAGIYIHIPFCKQACHYCDFHFSTNLELQAGMVGAICAELSLQQSYLGQGRIDTIYFGGGTPSLLSPRELETILACIAKNFSIRDAAEITLEANPDDLDPQKLAGIRSCGINRLSIGMQSFDDVVLKYLNRSHDSLAAVRSFDNARAAGFGNISIDLIYSIPGQSPEAWESNIAKAVSLDPEHISSYSLTIEPKTVFGNWLTKGRLAPVPDDDAAAQMEILTDLLMAGGYEQYEISNFARPGYQARHNSSYWQREKYLGVGPSAHSFDGVSRQYNIHNNHHYIRSIQSGNIPFERELLSREESINDYLLTTLRTAWGCDLEVLKKDFNYDLLGQNGTYISHLVENNLADLAGNRLKLTRKGKLVADRITADLFLTTGQTTC
jgi:oxygen-independent coproporphyrinogen III oxidase